MPKVIKEQNIESEIASFQKAAEEAKKDNSEDKNIDNKESIKIKENKVMLENGKIITVYPTKIKYLKSGAFQGYKVIESIGIVNLLSYSDGEPILKDFLISTLDPNAKDNISSIVNSIYEDLSIENIESIINISKKLNGVKDEDFLAQIPIVTE